ncbi:MAG TPA: AsmA-like C-terminal region-containing protein, partial [Burkholderiaceae bacterium]|nr:AsmA-like C-terminal region-containing protein [Burkholderiaceae bacterium]
TDDFIVKGVNAVVRIKGSADLRAETQDLEIVVIPEINAGTAALAYALVNPAIGLGTFLANFLLRKPLSAAFTNIYEVTGSWSDPKVERVKAETGGTGARPAS